MRLPCGQLLDGIDNLLDGLAGDLPAALGAVGMADPGEEQTQIVVDLGDGAHGGAGVLAGAFLVDGDGRAQALDVVDIRLFHAAQELAGVGGERLHVAALSFGIDGIEGQRAFPGAGNAGNDHQLIAGDGDIDILEIVLAGTFDNNGIQRHQFYSLAVILL